MGKVTKFFLLNGLILFCLSAKSSAEVVVNYFHSTLRCETCLMIEQMTENVLQQEFPRELQRGDLIWQAVNIDIQKNRHFIKVFSLGANEIVIRRRQDVSRFTKVPDTWHLIDDYEKFRSTLTGMVQKALQEEMVNP